LFGFAIKMINNLVHSVYRLVCTLDMGIKF